MKRRLLDRWTDTTVFRVVLLFAGLAVVPVLLLGTITTLLNGVVMLFERSDVDLDQAMFALLSAGGVLGFVGYQRAHAGARNPEGHNVTATLVCLAAGVAAALVVAAVAIVGIVESLSDAWTSATLGTLAALFAAANLAWALSGMAWMQRLRRHYAEHTGHAFDGLPALLLFVALTLAISATLVATTL